MSTDYHLPDHAPGCTVRPAHNPSPAAVPDVPVQQAVDATDLDDDPEHR